MVINFSINYLAVFVASLVSFVFGWLWYGHLFGKVWSKANRVKMEKKLKPLKLLFHFLTTLILVLFFSFLLNGNLIYHLVIVVVIWVGFLVSIRLSSMIWIKQSWNLFFVDVTYHLINLIVIVLMLSLF